MRALMVKQFGVLSKIYSILKFRIFIQTMIMYFTIYWPRFIDFSVLYLAPFLFSFMSCFARGQFLPLFSSSTAIYVFGSDGSGIQSKRILRTYLLLLNINTSPSFQIIFLSMNVIKIWTAESSVAISGNRCKLDIFSGVILSFSFIANR